MEACPFCSAPVTPSQEACPACLGTLPREGARRPPRKRVDFSDRSTDAQAPLLQALEMGEGDDEARCALHPRARARGRCARCGAPACEICLSHGGVCAQCRRSGAPEAIAQLSRDLGAFTGLAGLALWGFAAWQQLDVTVLDADPRRAGVAVVLGLVHLMLGASLWARRRFGLAVACTGVVLFGALLPLLGGEPWWMALARVALAALLAARTFSLKRQLDELYLALDRPE